MSLMQPFRRPLTVALLGFSLSGFACAADSGPPGQGSDGQRPPHGPPPQVAIDACTKLTEGAACSFTGRRGEAITGSCHVPPQQSSVACVPTRPPGQGGPNAGPGGGQGRNSGPGNGSGNGPSNGPGNNEEQREPASGY
jgi:hypothetical protein